MTGAAAAGGEPRSVVLRLEETRRVPRAPHPWLNIGLRQLAVFDAIARRQSFRGAAREVGYVQSAVSRQVARLERTVGMRLIERGRGRDGVALTAAGELLAEHGRTILGQLRAAKADIDSASPHGRRPIHVGLCAGVAPWLIPRVTTLLEERRCDRRVEFLEVANESLLPSLVERGTLDIAIGVVPAADRRFVATPLISDPWVMLTRADSMLAHRDERCTAAELRATSVILPPPSQAVDLAVCQLEAAGVPLRGVPHAPIGPIMRAAVVVRRAVALAPRLSLTDTDTDTDADTAIVALEVTLTPREIGIFWSAPRRAIVPLERLLDAVSEVFDDRARDHVAQAI